MGLEHTVGMGWAVTAQFTHHPKHFYDSHSKSMDPLQFLSQWKFQDKRWLVFDLNAGLIWN